MNARGFALPLALLLLLALTGLAHGGLLLARSERRASRLAVELLARELAVRGTLLAVARSGDTLPLLPPGGRALLPGPAGAAIPAIPVAVRLTRLSAELYLLSGEAAGAAASEAGLLVWTLDAAARAMDPSGGAAAGKGGVPDEGVPGSAGAPPAACEALTAAPEPGWEPGAGAAATPPGLGLLTADTLLARAPVRVSGVVSPDPGADPWTCRYAPHNWGAPDAAAHPCASHRPFVAADGDLVVDGGQGQGVLAVRGDLALRGTLYHGLVLAGGRVSLEGGARVHGRVVAAGSVEADASSYAEADACAVYLALLGAVTLRVPILLPLGSWVRPL